MNRSYPHTFLSRNLTQVLDICNFPMIKSDLFRQVNMEKMVYLQLSLRELAQRVVIYKAMALVAPVTAFSFKFRKVFGLIHTITG